MLIFCHVVPILNHHANIAALATEELSVYGSTAGKYQCIALGYRYMAKVLPLL